MKAQKLIHYEVAVSPRFPSDHTRSGEPTCFVEEIQLALGQVVELPGDLVIDLEPKLHTCRKNYELWVKRMKKVAEGKAVIDLFYWKLKGGRYTPGNEKVVFATLDKDSGCGVQMFRFIDYDINQIALPLNIDIEKISKNDGLSLEDFKSWFKSYDLSKPLAIIHFTKFRY